MAVEHVKSTALTNMDGATPPVAAVTAGQGTGNYLKEVSGSAVTIASSSQNSTYQLVRVPSAAKIKEIIFESAAQAAGTVDLGVYYATDGRNGKATSLLAADAIDQDFFATDIAVTSAVAPTDVTNESGSYTIEKRVQPLWQAVGLTSDPGGFFDIVATIDTAITTGAARMGVSVRYTE